MAQYQQSQDFSMKVNGQPVSVTATFTGIYGSNAFGGYVSNYDFKLLPCDVASLPEFKSQLQSQVQAWVKEQVNNTRKVAGVDDAPRREIPGNNYIKDADQKAAELVENATNCLPIEQSQLNSIPGSTQPVNQDGRGGDVGMDIDPGRSLDSTSDGRNIERPAVYPGVLDLAGRGIRVGSAPNLPSSSSAPFGWSFHSARPRSPWNGES